MLNFLLSLFKNPKALFINGVLTKWYLLVMIPAIGVVYKIFTIMQDRGVFGRIEAFVSTQLDAISNTVDKCLDIGTDFSSLQSFLNCLN